MTHTTSPMLALMPGTRQGPGTGANTGPRPPRTEHTYRQSCSCPACVLHFQFTDERVFAGQHSAGYRAWLDHVWHAAACTRPIRLRGDIKHIDPATGELLRTIPTLGMPDGVIYKPCGNRRATTCPGCAETYRRDAYHLIRAGLTGGKGVTADVATHPAVFVPSPPPPSARSTPARSGSTPAPTDPAAPAGPDPATPAATPSPATTAGQRPASSGTGPMTPGSGSRCARTATTTPPTSCGTTRPGNCGGAPSKPSNAACPSSPATAASPPIRIPTSDGRDRLVSPVRVAHGEAAEYQARGAVHFHALLRLDGYDPRHPRRRPCPRRPSSRSPTSRTPPPGPPRRSATAPRRTRPHPAAGRSPGAPRPTPAPSP